MLRRDIEGEPLRLADDTPEPWVAFDNAATPTSVSKSAQRYPKGARKRLV
jgi:hypothetical protein